MKRFILSAFFIFLGVIFCTDKAQAQINVVGNVTSQNGEKLENVVVTLVVGNAYAITDENGNYVLQLVQDYEGQRIQLGYSLLGYVNKLENVTLEATNTELNVVLEEKNLRLDDVVVTAVADPNGASASSIAIGEEAIGLTQANSLKEVLTLLPGQTIENTDLRQAQSFAIRTVTVNPSSIAEKVGNDQKENAQFGTAIIIDGVTQSNNANLSTNRNVSIGGRINLPDSDGTQSSLGRGFDLRSIDPANIESIEVVGGVASAKYSDYTEGAIIINQKAGVTPWRLSANNVPGLINTSISKGFKMKEMGTLNVNAGYVNDNTDPTDDLRSFSRINTGVRWSFEPSNKWTNTLSLNYGENLDKAKQDLEVNKYSAGEYNRRNFSLSTRGRFHIQKKWSNGINYNFSFSHTSNKATEQNRIVSNDVRWNSTAIDRGISQARILPFPYVTFYEVRDKPTDFAGRINNALTFKTGRILHTFSQGINATRSENNGDGRLYSLQTPYFLVAANSFDYGVIKPSNYVNRRISQNIWGGYLEDEFALPLKEEREVKFQLGVRGDKMQKQFVVSPRLTTSVDVTQQIKLHASYGRNSKSAPLAYLYPNRGYYEFSMVDKPLYDVASNIQYNPVFTDYVDTTYTSIKPMVSDIFEVGTRMAFQGFSLQANYYYKNRKNGFSSAQTPFLRELPIETASVVDGELVTSYLKDTIYYGRVATFGNNLSAKTQGIEFLLNTDKIQAIQTKFDFTTAMTWGEYDTKNTTVAFPTYSLGFDPKNTANGIYLAEQPTGLDSKDFSFQSALTSVTTIPNIALVATLRSEFFWINRSDKSDAEINPVGVYDKYLNYTIIPESERGNEIYADFRKDGLSNTFSKNSSFANFHIKVAKEIGKVARLGFYANNFLNYRPIIKTNTGKRQRANQEPQFGGELKIFLK